MPEFLDLFFHLDETLGQAIAAYGGWIYAILFLIIFCETGLVVTPFLPGDSLLFAAGAFAAVGALDVWAVAGLLFLAAVLGDAVNYRIGRKIGRRAEDGHLLGLPIRRDYIEKTKRYYEKYGVKTIVIARFIPIVRTFAPFVAGVGEMRAAVFTKYNVLGAALWIAIFVPAGYFFGNIPVVKRNFELVILAIIAVSVAPAVIEILRARFRKD